MTASKFVLAMIVSDDREVLRRYEEPEPSFGPAPNALLRGLSGVGECQVHTLCCVQRPVRSPETIHGRIRHHSLLVPKLGWLRGAYWGCVRAVRRELRAIGPALVHGQGTERYCSLAAAFSGYPSLMTIHGNMRRIARLEGARPFTYGWLTARLEGVALRRIGGVICISNHTRGEVARLVARTWVVPNAIDPVFFQLPREPMLPATLLCVATIQRIKNQDRLIQALDPIAAQGGIRLVFLGRVNPDEAYGAQFLEMLKSRPWCEHPGHTDRQGLLGYLRRGTLLVLPSIEDNCPLVILEAMAAGVPVVASRIGGIPDLVEDGVDGLLFNPNDLQDIRSKVTIMLQNPVQAGQMAETARKRAWERYQPEVIAQRHVAVYGQFLEEMAGRG